MLVLEVVGGVGGWGGFKAACGAEKLPSCLPQTGTLLNLCGCEATVGRTPAQDFPHQIVMENLVRCQPEV